MSDVSDAHTGPPVGAPSFESQMSTWAKLTTLMRTEDIRVVQSRLSAPAIELDGFLPFGSSVTGGQQEMRRLHGGRPEADAVEDSTSQSIDLLSQCVAEPALKEFPRRAQRQTAAVQTIAVLADVWVQRPLVISTALSESLLYVQIDNVTEDASVVVEDVQLRGLNAHTFGNLPVLLGSGDKYCLILGIESALVEALALSEAALGQSPGAGGSKVEVEPIYGEKGLTTKCVLPLCLKWRPSGQIGENASIWSQFGAELRVALPSPLEVSFTCGDTANGVLSVVVTVKAAQDMDLTAHLPSADRCPVFSTASDRPPLFPLVAKMPFG
eukprot:Polyplicarium_translucidae@DN2239_c0_g1_i2.p1